MLIRLLLGLIIGGLVGSSVAAALVFGLDVLAWSAILAYPLGAFTGALVGLVAGKPIWAAGAKIEAGLKAFFGALVSAALLFAIRKWLPGTVDLSSYGLGSGKLGDLPAVALPVIAALLGGFYGLDNAPEEKPTSIQGTRLAQNRRVHHFADDDLAEEAEPRGAKRLQR